jgi:hypothetical protein
MPEGVAAGAGTATVSTPGGAGSAIQPGGGESAEPKIQWGDEGDASRDTGLDPEATGGDVSGEGAGTDGAEGAGDDAWGDETISDGHDLGDEAPAKLDYKALKEALATAPELFKQVKRALSENSRYKELAKSPEELRASFDTIERFGGLAEIEKDLTDGVNTWKALDEGNPAILDRLEQEHGEGFGKLIPHIYDRHQKLDPQGWAHEMSKVFMATLNQSKAGQISVLQAINALSQVKGVSESAEFKRIVDTINQIDEIAASAPDRAPVGDKKFEERALELTKKEQTLYFTELSSKITPLKTDSAKAMLSKFLKDKKVSLDGRKYLLKETTREFDALCKRDAAFQQNAKDLLKAKNSDGFTKMFKRQLEKNMNLAARKAWRQYAGISGLSTTEAAARRAEGQGRQEGAAGGASGASIKTQAPDPKDVDWARMREEFGSDGAQDKFLFEKFYYKKGDKKNSYSFKR